MAAAFAMRVLISASSDRLLSIVEPRYLKLSTASSVTLSMLIDGGETMPWPITFVFLMLIVSVQIHCKRGRACLSAAAGLPLYESSSAKSISLMMTCLTFVFALNQPGKVKQLTIGSSM